jgi:predicted AlkP superfamily phosphohydrolase/phosphomutase
LINDRNPFESSQSKPIMSQIKTFRTTLLLGLLALLVVGCGEKSEPAKQRFIILGFDGMDPVLAERWMKNGKLPNFTRLREMGSFQPLGTSNPPQSPVAWSSFATGLNPGQHGIYDFLRRDAQTYTPDFSISKVVPPGNTLELFGWEIPLEDGQIINRRVGKPFWSAIEEQGARSTVLRVPVTFPPDNIHRMLSGMGVPDLLGTQGTYTIYSTRPLQGGSSTRSVRVRPNRGGVITTTLEGPPDPLAAGHEAMTVPMTIAPANPGVTVLIGSERVKLKAGKWSGWIDVKFKFFGFMSAPGMVRLYLVEDYPNVQLYISPIHIDPKDPVLPLSSPPEYVTKLAQKFGDFHTIGMPEETWSLNEGHLPDDAFLDMEKTILKEREAMFFDAMERNDSELVIGVFVQTDRISHMFYRGIDKRHPLHKGTNKRGRNAILWIYRQADRILGKTLDQMAETDRLIVLSDHGFAPFRHAVHLNRWLLDNGYLKLNQGDDESGIGFATVDWSNTSAYAGGLNGLYLNLSGREAQGIVSAQQVKSLKAELIEKLAAVTDPRNGDTMVREVYDSQSIYQGNENDDKPDLVVGYQPGYRASWQTTLGAVPKVLVQANDRKWSGDHCIAPDAVPGVLFTSFDANGEIQGIEDIAAYVIDNWNTKAAGH